MTKKITTIHSAQSCHPDTGGNSLAIHTIHSTQPHSPHSLPTILSSRQRRELTRNSHNPLNTILSSRHRREPTSYSPQCIHHNPTQHKPLPTNLSSRQRRDLTSFSHNPLTTIHSPQSPTHNLVIPTSEGTHSKLTQSTSPQSTSPQSPTHNPVIPTTEGTHSKLTHPHKKKLPTISREKNHTFLNTRLVLSNQDNQKLHHLNNIQHIIRPIIQSILLPIHLLKKLNQQNHKLKTRSNRHTTW